MSKRSTMIFLALLAARATAVASPLGRIFDLLDSWWTFDGDLLDSHGTLHMTGTATYVDTTTGKRAHNTTALKTASLPPALATKNFSMGGRFTFHTLGELNNYMAAWNRTALGETVVLQVSASGIPAFVLNPFDGGFTLPALAAVVLGSTHSILATYDGVQCCFYVDGVLQGTTPFTATVTAGSTELQMGYDYHGKYWTDQDEVFICHAALTADEALALHNAGAGTPYSAIESARSLAIVGLFPGAARGVPYDETIDMVGSYVLPLTVDKSAGVLPPGLTLEIDATGTKARLHGTPPDYKITGTLPAANAGVYYSERLTVLNATGAVTVDIVAGTMPAWMAHTWHSATQEIEFYGTPT